MDETREGLTRFLNLLPHDIYGDLVILKGHLLIEEIITDRLNSLLLNNNPLKIKISERMMFSEKLRFLWSLDGESLDKRVWVWLKELNQIRNSMAHTVEPKGVQARISKLSEEIISFSNLDSMVAPNRKLGFSLAWLFIIISQAHNKPL